MPDEERCDGCGRLDPSGCPCEPDVDGCESCGERPAVVTVIFHDTPGLTFRYCAAPDCRDDLMRSIK